MGSPWVPMGPHGSPWEPMGSHGFPWVPMGSFGFTRWLCLKDSCFKTLQEPPRLYAPQTIFQARVDLGVPQRNASVHSPLHNVQRATVELGWKTQLWKTAFRVSNVMVIPFTGSSKIWGEPIQWAAPLSWLPTGDHSKETIRSNYSKETIRRSGSHDIFGVAHTMFLEWCTRYVLEWRTQ